MAAPTPLADDAPLGERLAAAFEASCRWSDVEEELRQFQPEAEGEPGADGGAPPPRSDDADPPDAMAVATDGAYSDVDRPTGAARKRRRVDADAPT